MPEETAFAVLVKIMFDYKHRELFKSGFHTLHLCLFQLDKLIEVCVCTAYVYNLVYSMFHDHHVIIM